MEVWSRVLFDNISNIITHLLEMWSIDYYKKCTVLCGDSMFFIIDGKWMFAFIHTHWDIYSYKNKYKVTEGTGLITKSCQPELSTDSWEGKIKPQIDKQIITVPPERNFTSFTTPHVAQNSKSLGRTHAWKILTLITNKWRLPPFIQYTPCLLGPKCQTPPFPPEK